MAQIVGGFIMPHAPHSVAAPDAPPKAQADVMWDAFAKVRQRIAELDVDTVIIIGDDHYSIHGPNCIPAALIGIGDVSGPVEPWLGVPKSQIPNNETLARHIMSHGHHNGVDWAYAKAMVLDHSCYVPWHHAVRAVDGVKAIPVYLNAGVDPFIPARRCYEIGQAIGRAVAAADSAERVAIYGTGGMSHWPGMARMGEIDPAWDADMLTLLRNGDVDGLMAYGDADVLRHGGNGGLEFRNWLCAMGALGDCTADVIAYEPVYAWSCGCAFAELKQAA